ncbi:MAG: NAD(P)/FAD-dependent oxidoreductase [Terracidiphilus sp.]|jgi:phytoene dehydrogenase-like protein
MKSALVIGSGPNGLAAAIALAQAGLRVEVYEAEAEAGGGARTLPLTLPGFLHDFGSAVHPMAVSSPFFKSLPLENYGLEWVHGECPLAHPLDDGSAVILERDLGTADRVLGMDGRRWRVLLEPLVEYWDEFVKDALGPVIRLPRHPLRMARFGLSGVQPARWIARNELEGVRARALFAGLAAHSFLSFDQPLSSAIGLVLGAAAHAVGWPVPRGGSGAITQALIAHLEKLGGTVHASRRIDAQAWKEMGGEKTLTLFDTTPRGLLAIAREHVNEGFWGTAKKFVAGPGVFKIDYALSQPVPWKAHDCQRALTVHLGGTYDEIAASEDAMARGRCAERPFVIAAQPSLYDETRAPAGKHVLWAYCHVPNGSTVDMTERIEAQIERFAPGFKDCVLMRKVWSPVDLEAMDANLVGGDISGGAMTVRQFLFRPSMSNYATGTRGIYLCSSSTPPGGGVHGMCGANAARLALKQMR